MIDGAAGLGYTLTEDPALPPQIFTRLEVEGLVLVLAEVRLAGDPALAAAAWVALAKITATLPVRVQRQAIHLAQQTYRFEKRPQAPAHLADLREACWDERALQIDYRNRDGTVTRRMVWPLSVVFLDRTLMLLAFCTLRQGFRRFHLGSMSRLRVTEARFRPRRVPLLREFLAELRSEGQLSPSRAAPRS